MKIIYFFLLIYSLFNISFTKKINFSHYRNLATDDCKEKTFLPTEKNVKITGRFYQKEDITWLIQSGSSIEFYVTAINSEILLVGDSSIYSDEDHRPRFGIYINDELFLDSTMNDLELNVELFKYENFEEKKTKIKVILLSENSNGGIGIKNINLYICSYQNSLEPAEKKKLNIEFIGDSITCAYGIEGKDRTEKFKTTTENFAKSFAYLASQNLDADYSTVCVSGAGIVSGYTSNGEKNSNNLMPNFYQKIGINKKYPGDWDFSAHKYDVIFIHLGTNDNNYVKADPENRNDEFIQEYINFLKVVRENNPDSYIICTLGIGSTATLNLVEQAVKLFDDDKVSFFEFPKPDYSKDGVGSDGHPNAITHEKYSKLVTEKISEIVQYIL